jgi:hypothetical protein
VPHAVYSGVITHAPADRECSPPTENAPISRKTPGGKLGRGLLAPEERDGVAYGVAAEEEKASHPARRSLQAGQSPQP